MGVHDSRSIFKLKKRVPIDSTAKRMTNVKKYASVVSSFTTNYQQRYLLSVSDKKKNVSAKETPVECEEIKKRPAEYLIYF